MKSACAMQKTVDFYEEYMYIAQDSRFFYEENMFDSQYSIFFMKNACVLPKTADLV